MLASQGQSGENSSVVDAVGSAVAATPWLIVALLILLIATGIVLLVARVQNNAASGGGKLGPDSQSRGKRHR